MSHWRRLSRLRPRFTLAALLVLITVMAIPLSYVAQRRNWNLRRKAAFEALTAKGVGLSPEVFDEFATPPPPAPPLSSFQKWWRGILLEDASPRVREVQYSFNEKRMAGLSPLEDGDVVLLTFFPELEKVEIHNAKNISDQGLASLAKLPKLNEFRLINLPQISGEFLKDWPLNSTLNAVNFGRLDQFRGEHLANLIRSHALKELRLDRCPLLDDHSLRDVSIPKQVNDLMIRQRSIGDETLGRWLAGHQYRHLSIHVKMTRKSVGSLATQRDLEQLYLSNAPLLDEDFQFLKDLKNLETLQLESMPVRGDLVAWIADPQKLSTVQMSNTLFDDRNFSKLRRFPNLYSLTLDFTPITGEGLRDLPVIPNGGSLRLIGTRLSEKGKDALAAVRPKNPVGNPPLTPSANPIMIAMPSNWAFEDFKRFEQGKSPWRMQVDIFTALEARKATGGNFESYSSRFYSRQASEPLDNCPADLMRPVIELHRQACMRTEDEESRASVEYFQSRVKP